VHACARRLIIFFRRLSCSNVSKGYLNNPAGNAEAYAGTVVSLPRSTSTVSVHSSSLLSGHTYLPVAVVVAVAVAVIVVVVVVVVGGGDTGVVVVLLVVAAAVVVAFVVVGGGGGAAGFAVGGLAPALLCVSK
jgi:hypothetical protein